MLRKFQEQGSFLPLLLSSGLNQTHHPGQEESDEPNSIPVN